MFDLMMQTTTEVQWCPGCQWMIKTSSGFMHNWGCQAGDMFMHPVSRVGWACPRCDRINSPEILYCGNCESEIA